MTDIATVEFVSGTTAGIVYVELGFIPDSVRYVSDHKGAPIEYSWINGNRFPGMPVANTVKLPGAAVANAADATSLITVYPGGDYISVAETDNTAGKHVNRSGGASAAGRITSPGIAIAATAQVNSGRNFLRAERNDM